MGSNMYPSASASLH
ncbi:BnaAnng41700D, partial [Brassica napus]